MPRTELVTLSLEAADLNGCVQTDIQKYMEFFWESNMNTESSWCHPVMMKLFQNNQNCDKTVNTMEVESKNALKKKTPKNKKPTNQGVQISHYQPSTTILYES